LGSLPLHACRVQDTKKEVWLLAVARGGASLLHRILEALCRTTLRSPPANLFDLLAGWSRMEGVLEKGSNLRVATGLALASEQAAQMVVCLANQLLDRKDAPPEDVDWPLVLLCHLARQCDGWCLEPLVQLAMTQLRRFTGGEGLPLSTCRFAMNLLDRISMCGGEHGVATIGEAGGAALLLQAVEQCCSRAGDDEALSYGVAALESALFVLQKLVERPGSKKSLKKHRARDVIASALEAYRGEKSLEAAVRDALSACTLAGL